MIAYQGTDKCVGAQWAHVPHYMIESPRTGEPSDQAVAFVLGRLSVIKPLFTFLAGVLSS